MAHPIRLSSPATTIRWWFVACLMVACTFAGQARQSWSTWTRQGGDAGMTKYGVTDLPASAPALAYKKRFYSAWAGYSGNYFYGNNLVIQNSQAVLFSNDVNDGTL